MFSREGSSAATSNVLLASGTIAFLAASACLFSSALFLNRLNNEPSLYLDAKPWTWLSGLSELKIGFQQNSVSQEIEAAKPFEPTHFSIKSAAKRFSVHRSTSAHATRITRVAKTRYQISFKSALIAPWSLDSIEPMEMGDIGELPQIKEASVVEQVNRASDQELKAMQGIHLSIQSRFQLAMRYKPVEPLVAHEVTESYLVASQATPVVHQTKVAVAWTSIHRKPIETKPKPVTIESKPIAKEVVAPAPKIQENPEVIDWAKKVPQLMAQLRAPPALTPLTAHEPEPALTTQNSDRIRVVSSAPEKEREIEAPKTFTPEISWSTEPPQPVAPIAQVAPKVEAPAPTAPITFALAVNAYSPAAGGGYSKPQISNPMAPAPRAQATTQVNTRPVTVPSSPITGNPDRHGLVGPGMMAALAKIGHEVKVEPAKATPKVPGISYVEGFDVADGIPDVESSELTHETLDPKAPAVGWTFARANSHLTTLYWKQFSPLDSVSIPLISNNASVMLAKIGNTSLAPDAGIVFGKLPAGWTIELSGRSDSAVFLDAKNLPVSGSDSSVDRNFALLNTAPGSHLLYVTSSDGKLSGAIGIPVLEGTATYVDLSLINKTHVRGMLLDGGAGDARGMANVGVKVIGQDDSASVTSADGSFEMQNLLTVSNYPLYFEARKVSGYVHRYRVSQSNLNSLTLFYIRDHQVDEWVSELEGGVSSESGIIVAAVPGVFSPQSDEKGFFPESKALARTTTLNPETYTLSGNGQLLVNNPLGPEQARFISVQVPEGPTITRVVDRAGATRWSELVIASPGVVNVVGPY